MENQFGRTDQQYILFHREDFSPVEGFWNRLWREDERKLPGHHLVIKGYLVRPVRASGGKPRLYLPLSEPEGNRGKPSGGNTELYAGASGYGQPDGAGSLLPFLTRITSTVSCCRKPGENYSSHLRFMRLQAAAEQLKTTDKSVESKSSGELGFPIRGILTGCSEKNTACCREPIGRHGKIE